MAGGAVPGATGIVQLETRPVSRLARIAGQDRAIVVPLSGLTGIAIDIRARVQRDKANFGRRLRGGVQLPFGVFTVTEAAGRRSGHAFEGEAAVFAVVFGRK